MARAQQLKNKDIPEAGAKALVLLRPEDSNTTVQVSSAVKAFVDGLLNLTCPDLLKDVPDYLGEAEVFRIFIISCCT